MLNHRIVLIITRSEGSMLVWNFQKHDQFIYEYILQHNFTYRNYVPKKMHEKAEIYLKNSHIAKAFETYSTVGSGLNLHIMFKVSQLNCDGLDWVWKLFGPVYGQKKVDMLFSPRI